MMDPRLNHSLKILKSLETALGLLGLLVTVMPVSKTESKNEISGKDDISAKSVGSGLGSSRSTVLEPTD